MDNEKVDIDILELTKSKALFEGKFRDFLTEGLSILRSKTSAANAGFWIYRPGREEFESITFLGPEETAPDTAIGTDNYDKLFLQLVNNQLVFVDCEDDNLTKAPFIQGYMKEAELSLWSSIQIWNSGGLFGIITLEWTHTYKVTSQDKMLMLYVASLTSQAYDSLLKQKEKVIRRREIESLRHEVLDDEKKALMKRLSDHAFYTSHNLRHPLSTMLALIELISISWDDREKYESYLQQLKIESMNLDDAIRVMTAKIELD